MPSKDIVCVVGQGFVGSVMSVVIANTTKHDYFVYGLERDTEFGRSIVSQLNSGSLPFNTSDSSIEVQLNNALQEAKYAATTDPSVISEASTVLVDINLDVHKTESDYTVVMEPFVEAIETIGSLCRPDALIIIETTVPPGTCEKIVYPTISRILKDRGLSADKIKIGHSYERVMPGDQYISSIVNMPRVYAGISTQSSLAVARFLSTILNVEEHPLIPMTNTNESEFSKVLENSYRAANISFMIEWSRFAENANVDIYKVVHAIRGRSTHKNIMLPGIGVGGYCLTKDSMLAEWSAKEIFNVPNGLPFSVKSVRQNDLMPTYAAKWCMEFLKSTDMKLPATVLGVAYKGDVGDTRYSPVEKFSKLLEEKLSNIEYFDPHVKFWLERNMDIESDENKLILKNRSVIFLCTAHRFFSSDVFLKKLLSLKDCIIFDFNGILEINTKKQLSNQNKVHVLGVGKPS